jgi:UDP-N-acetylglucosamine 2-epimerase (non-hydrolysing)/GDP/UDP-N,N'-diacetylbacillosamine 2-epimerase (hydrolysing)
MKMRKVAVVTGTRAEYGILKPVLRAIKSHPRLNLILIVTGMHLSKEFGYTIKEIIKDGFKIDAKVEMLHKEDTRAAMAKSIGKCVIKMTEVLEKTKPDLLVLLGDRAEMLAGAVAASYMGIPIAHLHGGEVSGSIDDSIRHAITKLAHIHFPATQRSAERIIKMGEDPSRVFVVGAPALDTILNEKLPEPAELSRKYGVDLSKPILLVLQHSVVTECEDAADQIKETLEAIVELKHQTILIYPNADAGGRRMVKVIKKYEKYPFIKSFKSLPYKDYLGLMSVASVMIGNSSSGIIEAPSFHLPVVNIGSRQNGRERSTNVIDVGYDRKKIIKAVEKALYDEEFRKNVRKCKNPYGDGKAGERIAKILAEIKITPELLQKKITY